MRKVVNCVVVLIVTIILIGAGSPQSVIADDDHPEWPNATSVGVPSTTPGIIDPQGDFDWFRFPAQAGVNYRARVLLGSLSGGYVRVYRQSGAEIGSSPDGDFSWTAAATEDNYVEVWGGASTGTYQLSLTGPSVETHYVSTSTDPGGIGVPGAGNYEHNSSAFIGPAPDIPDYTFSYWRRDGSQNIGTNPSGVSVTVNADMLIEAVYIVTVAPPLNFVQGAFNEAAGYAYVTLLLHIPEPPFDLTGYQLNEATVDLEIIAPDDVAYAYPPLPVKTLTTQACEIFIGALPYVGGLFGIIELIDLFYTHLEHESENYCRLKITTHSESGVGSAHYSEFIAKLVSNQSHSEWPFRIVGIVEYEIQESGSIFVETITIPIDYEVTIR